jgi:hypothetical protein
LQQLYGFLAPGVNTESVVDIRQRLVRVSSFLVEFSSLDEKFRWYDLQTLELYLSILAIG